MEATEEQGQNLEMQGLQDTRREVLPPARARARGRQAGECRGPEAVLPQG